MEGQRPSSPSAEGEIQSRCASGATQKEGKAARRPPADVPAAAILKKLRHDAPLIHPKRKTAPASRSVLPFPLLARLLFVGGFCRTASCGEPLDRVPLGPTAHRAVGPSLPDLLVSFGGFRPLRRARKGLCPFHPHQPFGKGWIENFLCLRCGTFPTGYANRRRVACRAATEAWREAAWPQRHVILTAAFAGG